MNFPPMRALEFIRDHVTFKLPYDFSYQMKIPKTSFLIATLKALVVKNSVLHNFGFGKVSPAKQL